MRNVCRAQSAWMRLCAFSLIALLSMAAQAAAATGENLAVYHLTAGWATFGLALPQGDAPSAVQVGSLATQTDVKSRWPDGSIKFAVVSANVPTTGHYAITAAAAPTGSTAFNPLITTPIIVEFTVLQPTPAVYRAVFGGGSQDRWLSGPLVHEARTLVTPTLLNTGSLGAIRVLFDVRSYATGGHRIDVTVENSLDVDIGDAVTYNVKVLVGGAIKFQKDNVFHRYLARWRQVVTTGVVESAVAPDFSPFMRARALPNYLPSVHDVARSITTSNAQQPNVLLPEFEILRTGHLTRPMNAHSGRPELAPYPDWTAQAIVHRRREQLDYVLKHGELAGSWGIHIKKPDGVNLISINERPDFWLDDRAAEDADPPANTDLSGRGGQVLVDGDPTSGTGGDINHQPSLAYVPYLITGDRYFLDEVKYWANFVLIGTYQDRSQNLRGGGFTSFNPPVRRYPGSHGLLTLQGEIRGIGWGLRNLTDAAFILPDADPMKAYFTEKVTNNLVWLDEYAREFNSGPLGAMFPNRRPEDAGLMPYVWIALWEHRYVGWAVDHARFLGFTDGLDFLTRLAKFELKLFTSSSEGFPREWAGMYVLAIGTHSDQDPPPVDWENDVITYYPTMKEIFDNTTKIKDFDLKGNLVSIFQRPFEGFYGPEARLMLMVARGLALPGAQAAYDYLMDHAFTTWPDGRPGDGEPMLHDLNERSGWAIGLGGVNPLMTDVIPSRPNPRVLAASTATAIQ
jgi:hypothetical protein